MTLAVDDVKNGLCSYEIAMNTLCSLSNSLVVETKESLNKKNK